MCRGASSRSDARELTQDFAGILERKMARNHEQQPRTERPDSLADTAWAGQHRDNGGDCHYPLEGDASMTRKDSRPCTLSWSSTTASGLVAGPMRLVHPG